jgi:hypothetical protein|tara:strand:- start:443 stop:562 length:120 start_codon:yes stop_codon:yes gene_type:complete
MLTKIKIAGTTIEETAAETTAAEKITRATAEMTDSENHE